jgi:acyl-CoA thioesterase FadM
VLDGTTRVVGFRRVWSRRETTFDLPDGSPAATVRIDWVLLDETGNPTRIPAEFEDVFAAPPAALQLARVTIGEPPPDAERRRFRVRAQELDPMAHVNNAAYADWLDESILEADEAGGPAPTGAVPRRVRLEYARAAEGGESLDSACWRADGGWSCLIARAGDGAELLRGRVELQDRGQAKAS